MRAILINPFDETVTEIDLPPCDNNLKPMYDIISEPSFPVKCDLVGRADWVRGGCELWVDEEGLLKSNKKFLWKGAGMFYGKGILTDSNIKPLSAAVTVDKIKEMIVWQKQ